MNPNTADESSVAKDETGKSWRQVEQRLWEVHLRSYGAKEKINALNREIGKLLREKKKLVLEVRAKIQSKAPLEL